MQQITEAERYLAELKYAMDYFGHELDKKNWKDNDAYVKYDVAKCKYQAAKKMMEIMKR